MLILEFGLLDDHPNAEPRVMAIAIKLRVWAPIGRPICPNGPQVQEGLIQY